ncbi:hypothetical protein THMIRHAS_12390 [Thiosulfatimonas sediminis]|uniref:Uncharacterized protein n=1 Tax=Thiosulfatimonas sediminis TaxID=2675054 RepID=A0A6F8PUU7_9GAMM|nr:hypothetical protein [Thiosulfatimonas sediminis]BBP45866.1 hypothetical protein THMIRHAS_12390 [Thiosulfatimonas sediminis]
MKEVKLIKDHYSLEDVASILSKYDHSGAVTVEDVKRLINSRSLKAGVLLRGVTLLKNDSKGYNLETFNDINDLETNHNELFQYLKEPSTLGDITENLGIISLFAKFCTLKQGYQFYLDGDEEPTQQDEQDPDGVYLWLKDDQFIAYPATKSFVTGEYNTIPATDLSLEFLPTVSIEYKGKFYRLMKGLHKPFTDVFALTNSFNRFGLFVEREELAAYLEAPKPTDQQADTPPYLDQNSPYYSLELDIAIQAHKAFYIDKTSRSIKDFADQAAISHGVPEDKTNTFASRVQTIATARKDLTHVTRTKSKK